MFSAYFIHLLIIVGINLILSVSLQVSIGFGGLLNLGHIAFFGIGAYATALLTLGGLSFWSALIVSGLVAAFFGFLLAIPTGKLKGDYLALVTLGFTFVIFAIFLNWTEVTRGPLGLPGIPRPELFGFSFLDNIYFLILTAVIAVLSYFFVHRLITSPFGKVLEATRDDELATKSLGKNTFKIKSITLAFSAFFAGISGSLFAVYITFIDPSSFTLMALIPILLIVMVGGLASLPGTALAALVITLLPEPLRFIGFPSSILGPARQIVYALLLLIIVYFRPRGFSGKVDLE